MRSKFKWIFTLMVAFTMQFSFAQQKTVTGVVSDDLGTVAGASVVVKGTTRGVTTDFDGNYSISVNVGEVLVVSFAGQQSSVTVGAANVYDVKLTAIVGTEVVLEGYRTTLKTRSVAAVNTVSISDIEERSNASVIQNLQGMVSGLNIGTGSGQPGADSTIILRGVGSINGNIEPLFIVDGIPVDEDGFRSINQNDIESISVIKDAAGTSVYGNRGANGVILITTKKGSFNQDMSIRYTSQYGNTKLQKLNIDLMTSNQILNLQKDYGVGYGATLSDVEINALTKQTNTNWADIFFRVGTTQSHDLSLSTGGENSRNVTNLGYFEQDGIFINTNFKRFSARNNFSGKTKNEKFDYAVNLSANFSRSSGVDGAGSNATFFAPFTAAMRGLPYLNPYNPDGSLTLYGGITPGDGAAITGEVAPLVLLNSLQMNTDIEDELKMLTSFSANYKLRKDLTLGTTIGMDYSNFQRLEVLHPNSILGPFQVNQNAQFGGIQDESVSRDFRFNSLLSLKYSKVIAEKHSIDVSVFTEYYKAHYNGFGFVQRGLDPRLLGTDAAFIAGTVTEDLDGNPNTPPTQPYIPTVSSFKVKEGLFSYFGQLDYDYNNRFGLGLSLRRDASFRFIGDNRWGTFWSVGGRWNIDKESFMEGSIFNILKLRSSYGIAGNQRVSNTQYSALNITRSLYDQGGTYNGASSTSVSQVGNPDVRWEEIQTTDVGVDFALWQNKLSGNLDFYKKTTTDLYQSKPISPTNIQSSLSSNIGSLENKGVEIALNYTVYNRNDWKVEVFGNTSYNKNKIIELPESYDGLVHGGGSTALGEGQAIGSFYVIKYAGVNPSNGNALFYKKDGSLTETLSDDDRVFMGKSTYPVWTGGFGGSVSYKGFSLYNQWSYVADIYRNNLDFAQLEEVSTVSDGGNRTVSVLNAWQNPGDITTVPRVGSALNAIDFINSTDRYLEDASYLRLRNINFSYSFSKKMLEGMPFTGLKFFIQGENLVTFSSYRGWDAEANFRSTDRGNYPTPKIYTFGATINF